MALNLHFLANKTISMAVPNVNIIIIRHVGTVMEFGSHTPIYGDCEKTYGQMQSLNSDEQELVNNAMQNELSRKFFLGIKGSPITSGRQDLNEAPTYLYTPEWQRFWRIYSITEDFQTVGWAQVFASLQPSVPSSVSEALIESRLVNPKTILSLTSKQPVPKDNTLHLKPSVQNDVVNLREPIKQQETTSQIQEQTKPDNISDMLL